MATDRDEVERLAAKLRAWDITDDDKARIADVLGALREKLEAAEADLRHMEGFDCCTCGPCALHPDALAEHDARTRKAEREAIAYYIGAVPSEVTCRQGHMEAIRTGRYLSHGEMQRRALMGEPGQGGEAT